MTKKKIALVACLTLFCVVFISLFLYFYPIKLVTGQRSELQKITIIEDLNYGAEKSPEIIITDAQTMYKIYDSLAYQKTSTNKSPSHHKSLQFDYNYKIIFEYENTTDEIVTYQNNAYRLLKPPAKIDPGFTYAKAPELLDLIDTLTKTVN